MGLDISVVKVDKDISLENIYLVRNVIDNGFNWQLTGETQEEKNKKYDELLDFAKTLTREQILDRVAAYEFKSFDQETYDYLNSINPDEFKKDIDLVVKSIGDNSNGNSHLFFDWEKLPGTSIMDGCSWELQKLLASCSDSQVSNAPGLNDTLIELDISRLKLKAKEWQTFGIKLNAIKWIGFFKPEVAERMMEDFRDLHHVPEATINELLYFRTEILKVNGAADSDHRLWLVSSY